MCCTKFRSYSECFDVCCVQRKYSPLNFDCQIRALELAELYDLRDCSYFENLIHALAKGKLMHPRDKWHHASRHVIIDAENPFCIITCLDHTKVRW